MIASPPSDTLRAILLMVLSMAGFAAADMFIKLNGPHLPPSQILTTLGLGGTLVFGLLAKSQGLGLISPRIMHPAVLTRGVCEIIATCGFLMALTLLPFSTASSILQAAPLIVTLGAAVLLRETISWRRWSAILVGFAGVIVILNPTNIDSPSLFTGGSLLAIIGVIGLAGRDLATRYIPKDVANLQAATWGFTTVILAGLFLALFSTPWVWPGLLSSLYLLGMVGFGVVGYFAITAAMRIGDVSAVAPFRYSRIIFAFALSVLVFGEALTSRTLIGAALIVGAGLYIWLRERQRAPIISATEPPL